MVDPGFVSSFIGYGITKSLDEVQKWLKKIQAFPEEYFALESRLVRIRPLVEAIEQASHQPGVGKWVDDLKTLLDDSNTLLKEASVLKKRTWQESRKKSKFFDDVAKLTGRYDTLLKDGVLVQLVKVDSGLAKNQSTAYEIANCLEKYSQSSQTIADEHASETQRKFDSIMEELHALSKKVDADTGYRQHLFQGLGIQDQQWSRSSALVNQPIDHPLASTLGELAEKTGRDKRCNVKLEIADPTDNPPNEFRPPREIVPSKPAQASAPDHRGRAVEGGFEVHNYTKVQLTFEVAFSDDWFFYILQVDHAAEGSTPKIFFPKRVGEEEDYNLLPRRNKKKRVFPSNYLYEDDPLSLKLERTNIVAADSYDRVSLYVLVVNTSLTPDHEPSDAITIEDVENALERMLPQELHAKNVIVKRFQFDLKPSQFR